MGSTQYFKMIDIDELELDRNNPRIKSILEMYQDVDEDKIKLALMSGSANAETAGTTYTSLRESIKTNGGIINPIIVSYCAQKKEYTVVEGNTRVQIYKEFKSNGVRGNWDQIPSIVFEDLEREKIDAIRLQAHLVGPRDWDPYSKAKYLNQLYNEDYLTTQQIVDFCGGKKQDISDYIEAYKIMETYYRPRLNSDDEFEKSKFSAFREILKTSSREALAKNNFTLSDFSDWVIQDKFKPLNEVRNLPMILNNDKAREEFLKPNRTARDAIKLTVHAIDTNQIDKLTLELLLDQAIKRIKQLSFEEFRQIKNGEDRVRLTLLNDAYDELKELMVELTGDLDG